MAKSRPIPSLPKLRCLLDVPIDADDVRAGKVVASTHMELIEALEPKHWQARQARLENPPELQQRRRRRKLALSTQPEPLPAELLSAEALTRPAPAWPQHPPAIAPRNRSAPPPRQHIPKNARLVTLDIADPDSFTAAEVVRPPPDSTANGHVANLGAVANPCHRPG